MTQITAQAFGVLNKDGTIWPAASATAEGMTMTVAELFGLPENIITKAIQNMGASVVPVTIIYEPPAN